MSDGRAGKIAELERRVRDDADGEGRALLAELYRREGRLAEAERTAREGLARTPSSGTGLAVLVLALLDADRITEARIELEERAASALAAWSAAPGVGERGPAESVSEAEFERAFDAAEPQLDQMITPDRLAEEAALRVDGDLGDAGAPLSEPAGAEGPVGDEDGAGAASESADLLGMGGAFSTRTMAELLEQQGDARGAARIRAALGAAPPDPAAERNARVVAALERWLENVRRHAT